MRALVAALSLLAVSSPVLAQDPPSRVNIDRGANSTPGDTRRTGDTNENGERLICRSASSSSTSRMAARRVCRTEAEWRAARRAAD